MNFQSVHKGIYVLKCDKYLFTANLITFLGCYLHIIMCFFSFQHIKVMYSQKRDILYFIL